MPGESAPGIRRLRAKYGDAFHFVAVYIAESHPRNGINPYFGFSTPADDPFGLEIQPTSFRRRFQLAERFPKAFDGLHEGLFDFLLVDEVADPSVAFFNPAWSLYGPAPNPGWLIGQDGIVRLAQMFIARETIGSGASVEPGSLAVGEAMLSDAMNKTLLE